VWGNRREINETLNGYSYGANSVTRSLWSLFRDGHEQEIVDMKINPELQLGIVDIEKKLQMQRLRR